MAVYGVGIDLVQVDRIRRNVERWGERFEERLFTRAERGFCAATNRKVSCLALRFAAKEAFSKALGRGMRSPILWQDVEVRSGPLGKPEIELSSRAEAFCRELGIRYWHLSLTDDGDYGAAVVILER